MVKDSNSKQSKKNINEPGFIDEENIYQKKNEEERKKIPVEYLSHVQKKHARVFITTLLWWIFIAIMVFFAPGLGGYEYCPECGRIRTYYALTWGHWEFRGLTPQPTKWTEWYEKQNPRPHKHHWVKWGGMRPALFGFLKLPIDLTPAWEMPENLITRLEELENQHMKLGKILEIPVILQSVNNAKEWRAIIVPLTVGTPQDAYTWWQANRRTLNNWAARPLGTPLSKAYIDLAEAYIAKMTEPEGYEIPLIKE